MHKRLKLWLLEWFSSLEEKKLVIGLMALYHMRLVRNDAREAPMIEDPNRVARRVLGLTDEWLALNDSNSEKSLARQCTGGLLMRAGLK
jgi:hypothetical protein